MGWIQEERFGQAWLRPRFPEPLQGRVEARFLLKGPCTLGTAGDPGEILRRLEPEPGMPSRWIAPVQRHGVEILSSTEGTPELPDRPEGDGILLARPGRGGVLRFADCVPVLLAGTDPEPWILGLHGGYAGTVGGIVPAGLDLLAVQGRLGGAWAWIGPGIGPCCYLRRVEDPATREGRLRLPPSCWTLEGDQVRFDLKRALGGQLQARIPVDRVMGLDWCTYHQRRCLSYRRGDREDRMALLFWISP